MRQRCRDKRIFSTGCAGRFHPRKASRRILGPRRVFGTLDIRCSGPGIAGAEQPALLMMSMTDENLKMTDCYYETKDWRACKDEVCKARSMVIREDSPAHKRPRRAVGEIQAVLECAGEQYED